MSGEELLDRRTKCPARENVWQRNLCLLVILSLKMTWREPEMSGEGPHVCWIFCLAGHKKFSGSLTVNIDLLIGWILDIIWGCSSEVHWLGDWSTWPDLNLSTKRLDVYNVCIYSLIWFFAFFYSDACWRDFLTAAQKSTLGSVDREELICSLQKLWTSKVNPNPVLPCLSVRTGLDLYLRVMQFPPGSEVIMSAINIPSMVQVCIVGILMF